MEKIKKKRRFRSFLRWLLWIFVAQFVLLNISTALYAYKFTHLYTPNGNAEEQPPKNIFAKTWRLFAGPKQYKSKEQEKPSFDFTTVNLETAKKMRIEAWYAPADSVAKGTVILFHGLTGNKSLVLQQAYEFRYWGFNVMLVDSRAHGNSEGFATTIGYREAEEVKLAYDFIKNKGERKIYLWGFSMGAVQVLKAIADYGFQPEGIILQMPFETLQSHIKARMHLIGFPRQPFGSLITFWIGVEQGFNSFNFDAKDYAAKVTCPVLLQYGLKDQLVSKKEIERLYAAFPSANKWLVEYTNANHESFLQKEPVQWRKEIGKFLNTETY